MSGRRQESSIARAIPRRAPSRRSMAAALAALRRRPELRRLVDVARRFGIDAWVVGGALRDLGMGLAAPEVDVAVSRDAEIVARALEGAGAGRAVFISRDRPGPRVFRVAGPRPLDIAEIEGGSIASDLARRDFTVNAVALDTRTGALIDPFGGLPDLARRRLRCVREENVAQDPLRALRAARLLATHGLNPDAGVLRASRAAAHRLTEVAAERVAAELSKLLAADAAAPAISWAGRAGLLPGALRVDVSDAAARRLARSLAALDGPAIRRLPPERRRRLRLARLASRLAGTSRDTRRWLGRLRWGRRETEAVARLVDLAAAVPRARTTREAWAWLIDAGALAEDALILARSSPDSRPAVRRLSRLDGAPRRTVAVNGDDVVRWLGIDPGPAVGAWLSRVAIAAAMGEVKNRRDARHWLSGQARSRPRPAIIGAH